MTMNNQQTMSGMGNMYMVENITVVQNNHPLPGVFVTLGNSQVETNTKGIASFDNIYAGKQTIYLYYNKQNEMKTITISRQDTTVIFDQHNSLINVFLIVITVLAIVVVTYFLVRRTKNR